MGSTLQPGLRHGARVEASRDRTFDFMGDVAGVASTGHRLAGKAAKAGLS